MDSIENIYTTGAFKNQDGYRLYLEDQLALYNNNSLKSLLIARLPGFTGDKLPAIFIDECLVPPYALDQLPLPQISFIKSFGHFVLAPGSGGAIAIYTKKYVANDPRYANSGDNAYNIIGYNISKEFYNPVYDNKKNENSVQDKRKTLYWNPQIVWITKKIKR